MTFHWRWFFCPAIFPLMGQAQQAGTVIPEVSPSLVIQSCTTSEGCIDEDAGLVLDANWRWLHNVGGYQNCFEDGEWKFCSNPGECKKKCEMEGVDAEGYQKTYGVHPHTENGKVTGVRMNYTSGEAPNLNVGSRLYVTTKGPGTDEVQYKMFKLLNREFTMDVDVKTLQCGMNGAVYFIEMDAKGGMDGDKNTAGAKYGTGYCDAQCPHEKFETNASWGICCVEMDIWEANKKATAYTPHPCDTVGPVQCKGEVECGRGKDGKYRFDGLCDKDGCDFNAYRMGAKHFYGDGPDFEVDSDRPLTIVTQFLTNDGTDDGTLSEIRRLYVQDGVVIGNAPSTIPGVTGSAITDAFCNAQKQAFGEHNDHQENGGLASMGETLKRGMVLSVSIWDDFATKMAWLDASFPPGEYPYAPGGRHGVLRGPCNAAFSDPTLVREFNSHAYVTYSNIKYGEIGSTFSGSRRLKSKSTVYI